MTNTFFSCRNVHLPIIFPFALFLGSKLWMVWSDGNNSKPVDRCWGRDEAFEMHYEHQRWRWLSGEQRDSRQGIKRSEQITEVHRDKKRGQFPGCTVNIKSPYAPVKMPWFCSVKRKQNSLFFFYSLTGLNTMHNTKKISVREANPPLVKVTLINPK